MTHVTIHQAMQIGMAHHQAGRLKQAEQVYRQVLAQVSDHADAMHLLGVIAHQVGRNEIAVDLIRRAIARNPNLPEAYSNLGLALGGLGRRSEAISSYRQAVALNPGYAEAYSNLGLALKENGQLDEAIAACGRAIELRPNYAEAYNNLAVGLVGKRRFDEAIAACRRAIELRPNYGEAYSNLGIALNYAGRIDEAIDAQQKAVSLQPGHAHVYNNLGSTLQGKGRREDAIAAFRRAISLNPNHAEAHNNLGLSLLEMGQLDDAIGAFEMAIAINPKLFEAHNGLGLAMKGKGQIERAIASYSRAIEINPDCGEAYANLGAALQERGQLDQAIAADRVAILLRPKDASAYSNLSMALQQQGQIDEAIAAARKAVALDPDLAEAYNNLGAALKENGQFDEAIAAYRRSIELRPGRAEACNNLGIALKDQGQPEEARIAHEQAVALQPDSAAFLSNLLLTLQYHPRYTAQMIYQEHRRWNERFGKPLNLIREHRNVPDPNRRLKVGYVSPDFGDHIVGRNVLPLLQQHDRRKFEMFCYATAVERPADSAAGSFRATADAWRNIVALSDRQVCDQIQSDEIDILVDLALHTAHNRLPVFAHKAAPIQVTWAGYPGTTGLDAIDYRLTDPYLDPPGEGDETYSERSIRLPHSFWCFRPSAAAPDVNPLPALSSGFVTFGCLNNLCKVTEVALDLWAQVLLAVKDSRLLIRSAEGYHRDLVTRRLEAAGLNASRIKFVKRAPLVEYLELHHEIDIALDPIPYTGHSTSLDAFWMGVPVVTLLGTTVASRGGASISSNLGLTELIAKSDQEYVAIAARLAGDLARLSDLRATLRERMRASPLMDEKQFARDVETAYRQMWREWCESAHKRQRTD